MNTKKFIRNYSKNDLRKLIFESEKRAKYLNRIIDNDIHLNMVSESNSPLKEKYKYCHNKKDINIESIYQPKTMRLKLNNDNNLKLSHSQIYENRKLSDNGIYNLKNNNLSYSINVNKPFHREKRHFPNICNRGNFFRKENHYLLKRKVINNKNVFSFFNNNNHKNCRARHLIRYNDIKDEEDNSNSNNGSYNYRSLKIEKSNSMVNMSNNFPKINKYNNNNDYYRIHSQINQKRNNRYEDCKHYSPYRYDYEGSRYGDKTYNYLLKGPMRGDINIDWKYPPIYYYDSIHQ